MAKRSGIAGQSMLEHDGAVEASDDRIVARALARSAFVGPIAAVLLATACARPGTPDRGRVYLIRFDGIDDAEVQRARRAAELETGRDVALLPPRRIPSSARRPNGRVDAAVLLDATIDAPPHDAYRVIGVTSQALATAEQDDLIGYARRGERGLIYSTHLLERPSGESVRAERTRRVVAHELGHTYGAGHCNGPCLMQAEGAAGNIDELPPEYCDNHRELAELARARNLDHPAVLSALARERLRLNHWREAVAAYRQALDARPRDAQLHVELGVALMGDAQLTAAEEVLRTAGALAPGAPQPDYALAVLYAAGYHPERAPAAIERAVKRDGKRARAHRAAGVVYQDLLDRPDHAIAHYRRHLQVGGRSTEVVARLAYLMRPTMIVFDTPELVIAQWRPDRGLVVAEATTMPMTAQHIEFGVPGLRLPDGFSPRPAP